MEASTASVHYGVRAENLESLTEPYAGALQLSNGESLTADLIFPVIGSRATSDILEALPGIVESTSHRIKTDAWMRPSNIPNVFAAGDVADVGDAMTVRCYQPPVTMAQESFAGTREWSRPEEHQAIPTLEKSADTGSTRPQCGKFIPGFVHSRRFSDALDERQRLVSIEI